MALAQFYARAGIYLLCLLAAFYAMQALDFERFLKQDSAVLPSRLLYAMIMLALAGGTAQFLIGFFYRL